MFDKLMAILKRGGAVTIDQMARELEASPEVVSGMIDHMTRQGWLRTMSASCDMVCSACTFVRDCTRGEQGRVWVSTADDQQAPAAKRTRCAGEERITASG